MLEINEVGDSTNIEWCDPDKFFGGIAFFKPATTQKLVFTGGKKPWDKAKKEENVLNQYTISSGNHPKRYL